MSDPQRSVVPMEALVFTVKAADSLTTGLPEGTYVVHYWTEDGTADLMFRPQYQSSFLPSIPVTRIEAQHG